MNKLAPEQTLLQELEQEFKDMIFRIRKRYPCKVRETIKVRKHELKRDKVHFIFTMVLEDPERFYNVEFAGRIHVM